MHDENEVKTDLSAEHGSEHDEEETKPVDLKGFAILQIITWTNCEIEKCREKLENEPSGRILAYLQGKIPGCKFALKAIEEIFHLNEAFFNGGEKPCEMSRLTQEQILAAEKDMEELQQTEEWRQFLGRIQERSNELKDFLLFEAKKSRDLDVHQGEYKGMITYQTVFDAIEDSAKFWRDSLFKKRDTEAEMRNSNDPTPALLPPGLPAPEDAEYEEEGGCDYDDLPDEGSVIEEDAGDDTDTDSSDPNMDFAQ